MLTYALEDLKPKPDHYSVSFSALLRRLYVVRRKLELAERFLIGDEVFSV